MYSGGKTESGQTLAASIVVGLYHDYKDFSIRCATTQTD